MGIIDGRPLRFATKQPNRTKIFKLMYAIGFNFPKNSYDQTTNEKNEILGVFTAALFI